MKRRQFSNMVRPLLAMALCTVLASCEQPQVYGSVGYSSYSGSHHGGGYGASISIGGRIR